MDLKCHLVIPLSIRTGSIEVHNDSSSNNNTNSDHYNNMLVLFLL